MICQKCGNYMPDGYNQCGYCGSIFYTQPPQQNNFNKKKSNIQIYIICILSVLVCLFLGLAIGTFAKNIREDDIYFEEEVEKKIEKSDKDDKLEKNDENVEPEIYDKSKKKEKSSIKSGYSTDIKHDNYYSNQNISNEEEARELIVRDSVSQKSSDYDEELLEIENRIINNYKITAVNMEGIDIELAREIEDVVGYIYNKYPTARKYLTNLTLINTTLRENYIAVFIGVNPFADTIDNMSINKTLIGLNSRYFLNTNKLENSTKEAAKVGHFPKNAKGASTVAHEFGHYLSFLTAMKNSGMESVLLVDDTDYMQLYNLFQCWNEGDNSLDIIEEAYANYKNKYNEDISLLEFRSSISQYAVTKDDNGNYIYDETISEAFHDCYLNGQNAAKASKEVVAVLEKEIQKL